MPTQVRNAALLIGKVRKPLQARLFWGRGLKNLQTCIRVGSDVCWPWRGRLVPGLSQVGAKGQGSAAKLQTGPLISADQVCDLTARRSCAIEAERAAMI